VLCRDELIGALTLDHEGGRTFSAQDQAVLRLFADEAAIVIKNARRYTAPQQALTDLRQTQEELIRAEKLRGLGQMAAGIAHDFNNTLATILGQTELLRLRFRAAP
jgi:C4-dicarboxylate-specific signal transduction histidine kinase